VADDRVARFRRGYEAFNRGDMEAVLDFIDPAIELFDAPEGPEPDVHHGHSGFIDNVGNIAEAFEDYRVEPERFVDAGDKLLVEIRQVGRGRTSGIEMEERMFHVWTLRDEKGVRLDVYRDRDQALAAAGLR
jgi:ketosteroid isomerase-like protein